MRCFSLPHLFLHWISGWVDFCFRCLQRRSFSFRFLFLSFFLSFFTPQVGEGFFFFFFFWPWVTFFLRKLPCPWISNGASPTRFINPVPGSSMACSDENQPYTGWFPECFSVSVKFGIPPTTKLGVSSWLDF